MKNSYLSLIVGHLNAPYGEIVHEDDVALALRDGSVHGLKDKPFVHELISSLFAEFEPAIIGGACYEVGVDLVNANNLYKELRAEQGFPQAVRWEDAMKGVIE